MSGFSEFERYDGVALAQLVQQREVSPEELLESFDRACRGAQSGRQRGGVAPL